MMICLEGSRLRMQHSLTSHVHCLFGNCVQAFLLTLLKLNIYLVISFFVEKKTIFRIWSLQPRKIYLQVIDVSNSKEGKSTFIKKMLREKWVLWIH